MDVKRMSIEEFRGLGFLQEVNRQFLHPLGLALEVVIDDEGKESLGGVWDYRDDPEGLLFDEMSAEAAQHVESLYKQKSRVREKLLGFIIQPIDHPFRSTKNKGGEDEEIVF